VNEVTYIGEGIGWQTAGNASIFLSFVASLFAAYCYFNSANNDELENGPWKKLGRIGFRLHSLGVIGIMTTLFCMIFRHMYQYHYVWEYSNDAMPRRYTLACFWGGQEGSFLLWTFWQVVLGNVLIRTAKKWEAPVMTVVSVAQVFLASMLLGFYIFGWKNPIGSNPFTLLKDTPGFTGSPIFSMPDYPSKLANTATGLNPLLQNYWMTIHPPTLFLGFASTVVPFAYAIAGLWKKKYGEWQLDALPWTFFGIMILGTGILMGGAWAYESLSFGGFWAWDPVENASLIPWLTYVGAGHVMIVHKARKNSALSTFLFPIITFILVLYSTFLTRSGILGNTSVHAFTDLGLSGQLLIYLFFFILLSIILVIVNWKGIPRDKQEEDLWSREFWMFLGALVLLMSCIQIVATTSIPVTAKLFGFLSRHTPVFKESLAKLANQAPPVDRIGFYNKWQIPFAILVLLILGFSMYFKFKNTDMKQLVRQMTIPFIAATVFTICSVLMLNETNGFYIALLAMSWFAVCENFFYWIKHKKTNFLKGGATFAHVGFALVMMGALISTSKKDVISVNTSKKSVKSIDESFSDATNIRMDQGDTLRMGDYYVTYTGKHRVGKNILYNIEYLTKDIETKKYTSQFTLTPLIQLNPQMGNVAEPSTRHFWSKDIYTHITYADPNSLKDENKESAFALARTSTISVGDKIFASRDTIVLSSLDSHIDLKKYNLKEGDIAVGAVLKVMDSNHATYSAEPIYVISGNEVHYINDTLKNLGMVFSFDKIDPKTHKLDISVAEAKHIAKDYIVMEAIVFPYINVLWIGCLIMILGTTLAIRQRILKSREAKADNTSLNEIKA